MTPERIGAFVEYVLRPLSEDWRLILERLRELNLPLSDGVLRDTAKAIVTTHLVHELIRAATYIIITGLVCHAVIRVL